MKWRTKTRAEHFRKTYSIKSNFCNSAHSHSPVTAPWWKHEKVSHSNSTHQMPLRIGAKCINIHSNFTEYARSIVTRSFLQLANMTGKVSRNSAIANFNTNIFFWLAIRTKGMGRGMGTVRAYWITENMSRAFIKKIIQNQKSKNNSYGCRDKVFYHTMVLTLQNLMFYLLKQKIENFFEDKTIWRHATIVIPVLCLQEKGDRENQHVKVMIMPSLP